MMTQAELKHLPIGTLVETSIGSIYQLQSRTSTHIILKNTKERPAYQPPNAPLYRETEKLTLAQACRLLVRGN